MGKHGNFIESYFALVSHIALLTISPTLYQVSEKTQTPLCSITINNVLFARFVRLYRPA